MSLYYDLHIHSALSPCSDEDMTPNNIVNMAVLKGLDVISVTDHNSAVNLPAVFEAANDKSILLLPGIEVQTKEEIHMLCYFKKIDEAIKFGNIIYEILPNIKNNPKLFGNQYIFDKKDNITGSLDKLLLSSSDISVNELIKLAYDFNGVCIPAHIDRQSYSIITNLGFIPENLNIKAVEISKKETFDSAVLKFPYIKDMNIIRSSDAHYLWDISEREDCFPFDEIMYTDIFNYLKGVKSL